MQVIAEIYGDTADVRAVHADQAGRVASRLLDAAGDRRREVRTITGGPGGGYRAPVDIVRATGFLPAEEPEEKPEPRKAPARSTAKSTAKTTAAKKTTTAKPAGAGEGDSDVQ